MILQPGPYNEELYCKITHANLDDNPHFEAVSYTWADQNGRTHMFSRVICQNGREITISANCDMVLRRIRARGCKTPLWIDMPCTYSHRTATKHLGTMRFAPQFFEGFNFTYLPIAFVYLALTCATC